MAVLPLSTERREAFEALARDLEGIFGDRFVALVAHGPGSSVAFATTIAVADLAAAARLADRWRRHGVDVPLLITPDEFRRSLDVFPVEYGAILRRHAVIAGTPPFDGARVGDADVRRALEVLAKGHVLHLRAGAIATGGRAAEGQDLIAVSIDPFRALLANAARLHGDAADTDDDLAAFGARALDLPADVLRGLLAVDDGADFDPSAVMPVYLDAAERLWKAIDTWKAR